MMLKLPPLEMNFTGFILLCTVNTCNHSNSTQAQFKPLFTIYHNNKFEANILSDSPAR